MKYTCHNPACFPFCVGGRSQREPAVRLHEIITCDLCNPDGFIDYDLFGGLDEGESLQVSGGEDAAKRAGWDVASNSAFAEHICPTCLSIPDPDPEEPQP